MAQQQQYATWHNTWQERFICHSMTVHDTEKKCDSSDSFCGDIWG